ncbi:HTH domain-containing protein [Natronomonas sp. EA1]|uniref:HTH domain-containing protein n=1 Tax=Natronomonas sp. EA1 TaxID=3421655 RepID=UPI003EBD23F7
MDETTSRTVRVKVWLRGYVLPDGPRRTVLSRLLELEAAEVVEDVSVRRWGKFIPASPDELEASQVHDRIAEFQQWADRNGHSLEPAFHRCEQSTMVSEERCEVIRLPLQCLAVYEDDQLTGVFPYTDDEGTNTVADGLRRLEQGDDSDEAPTR